ncbi:MAG TPA: hypothetical protein VI524_14950 [Anaerolineales bacterium]|nr:hypothetical protein [Anaerolineales bacterium]
MFTENWTPTEVLLATLSVIVLVCTLTLGILLARLTREIARTISKLNSLLTSVDVRIREISEAIIDLRLDLTAGRGKEELASKPKGKDLW